MMVIIVFIDKSLSILTLRVKYGVTLSIHELS